MVKRHREWEVPEAGSGRKGMAGGIKSTQNEEENETNKE